MKTAWRWVSVALVSMSMVACAEEDDGLPPVKPSGGIPGESTGSGFGEPAQSSLAETVVGAWSVTGTVTTDEGEELEVRVGWFLCSDGRMSGFTDVGNYSFLDKGDYVVDEGSGTIDLSWRSKDTAIGDTWGPDDATLSYEDAEDVLSVDDSTMGFLVGAPLYRLEGDVVDSDCDSAW